MIFFWDKNTPKTIPIALSTLNVPHGMECYLNHYPLSDSAPEGGDDHWLNQVGAWEWFVISQDYHFHEREAERFALKQHNIGCFYLWGAEAPKWDILRCFARAYDRIVNAAETTRRPFIYWVAKNGLIRRQQIP